MKLLSTVLMSVLALNIYSAETETAPELTRQNLETLDPAVRAEVQKALDEADRARVAYLQAIQRANESAIARIERQVSSQTRRGNLDGALAGRNMMKLLENGWLKDQVEAEFDLVGNRVVSMGISIVKAEYTWLNNNTLDITQNLRDLIQHNGMFLEFVSLPATYGVPDPASGIRKNVNITMIVNGETRNVTLNDGQRFHLDLREK